MIATFIAFLFPEYLRPRKFKGK
uniref:Uncharacterized protein n=1 Tax=Rhizophora mucronata TaxID=61149 RepID=A0A2P2NAS1_RHIMU